MTARLDDPRLPARFWQKVAIGAGGCWLWTGAKGELGYAQIRFDGRTRPAHVVAYEALVGPVPDGLELDHVRERGCEHRHCVNPGHLEAVAHTVNVRRGRAGEVNGARVRSRTHCPKGHPYEGGNLYTDPRGNRQCMECRRVARRRDYHRARGERA